MLWWKLIGQADLAPAATCCSKPRPCRTNQSDCVWYLVLSPYSHSAEVRGDRLDGAPSTTIPTRWIIVGTAFAGIPDPDRSGLRPRREFRVRSNAPRNQFVYCFPGDRESRSRHKLTVVRRERNERLDRSRRRER
jgi:hypothetical protein